MTKNTKIIIWVVIAVVIIGGIWYGINRKPAEKGVIKIGAILPLSGSNSIFGEWIKNGANLALKEIGDDKLKIVYEDSRLDPKTGLSAFEKLTNIDGTKIIISAMSSVSVPLISVAAEKNIPLFLQDVTYPNITVNKPFLMRHFIQSDREASELAGYALNELKIKKVGILYVNDEAGVGAKEAFKNVFEANGGIILIMESYLGKDTDIRSQILKIKNQDVEGIYLFGNGPSWAQALKQIKELGFKGVVLTNTAMFIKNFKDLAGNATEGVYFTFPYADSSEKSVKEFVELYKKEYGEEPAIEAYYAYDIVHVLKTALEKNNWEVKNLKKTVVDIEEFNGAFGKTAINSDGDFLTSLGIGVIENNQIKTIEIKHIKL